MRIYYIFEKEHKSLEFTYENVPPPKIISLEA